MPRYRLRTLLILLAAVGAVCGAARWWMSPFVLYRRSLGTLTEEVWCQRKFPNALIQTGLVEYYSDGKKACEFRYRYDGGGRIDGYPRFWLRDGSEVSREEFEQHIQALMREKT